MRRVSIAVLLLLAGHAAAQGEIPRRQSEAGDVWSEPSPGVRYLRRSIRAPATSIYALEIDLRHEGVQVQATPQGERWSTVSEIARTHDAAAAINGGFWGVWQRPTGVTAGGGRMWNNSSPDPDFGHFAIVQGGRAIVSGPGENEDEASLSRVREAVSGRPLLVRGGRPCTEELDAFASANQRQPRTAVGVSRDGRTVYFVVADGRQAESHGLTLYQLARVMVELGADRALNLDGGGSSTMYVQSAGGIVNQPCRGRLERAIGMDGPSYVHEEREVMNHLLVLAPSAPSAIEAPIDLATTLGPTHRRRAARPEPPALRVRELVPPALTFTMPLGAVLGAWLGWRRLRRAV